MQEGRGRSPDAHILSVLPTTAFLLITRTLVLSSSCSLGGVGGGTMSAAFVTEMDAGKIMGRISCISGNSEAILSRYLWTPARRIQV